MSGPIGSFYPRQTKQPMILLATGIGITPFRAIAMNRATTSQEITLIHSSQGFHLYQEELAQLPNQNQLINYIPTTSAEESLNQIEALLSQYGPQTIIMISGRPSIVKSLKANLIKKGLPKGQIIVDNFIGY